MLFNRFNQFFKTDRFLKMALLLICFFILLVPLSAQSFDEAGQHETENNGQPETLPRSFRSFSLGMDTDALKNALVQDAYINFRGERDVSILPAREETLIETTGLFFIRRAFFQLRDGQLFIMAFTLDTNLIDHYSIFTSFVNKYGEPDYLDPQKAVWNNENTRISIERPLTVKYIDLSVFNDLINESSVRESGEVWLRKEFINEF